MLFFNRVRNSGGVSKTSLFNDVLRLLRPKSGLDLKITMKRSSANNSGNGLFVSGSIKKHQLVSLYPGVYEPPPPPSAVLSSDGSSVVSLSELSLKRDSAYRIHCNSCGGYLDAAKSVRGSDSALTSSIGPYVLGHMINHPPQGIRPNVQPVDFFWHDFMEFAKQMVRSKEEVTSIEQVVRKLNNIDTSEPDAPWYIDPSTYEVVPLTANCAPKVGMALVAREDMECSAEGTELWLDYRYDLSQPTPDWYVPVGSSHSSRQLYEETRGPQESITSVALA